MTFEERKVELQKDIEELMKKYEINIYAANVVLQGGEVLPMIKMTDAKQTIEEEKVTSEETKEDEDKSKK